MPAAQPLGFTQWPFDSQFPTLQFGDGVGVEPESALLPATIASEDYHISTPVPVTAQFLEKDLYAGRLRQIERLIWLAGRPLPPRPFHQQILLSRKLVLSEAIELHLVWTRGVFFVKPLPLYLLDRDFWNNHLRGEANEKLQKCARGLIFSYTALIRYKSDFHIAQETGLLPNAIHWDQWRDIARSFLNRYPRNEVYANIDQRYCYGELRLGRLNKICRLQPRALSDVLYGYSSLTAHNLKADTFEDNLRLIGGSLAYLVIVLQAMQIGLTTQKLQNSHAFQDACYGFAIFSILAPLGGLGAVLAVFIFLLVINVVETLVFEKKRFRSMHRTPPRLKKGRETEHSVPAEKA